MKRFLLLLITTLFLGGCATTPMDTPENDANAKQFTQPQEGHSGLYIYRNSLFGRALKKNLFVDGEFIGESAPDVFFYKTVKAGEHTISTESEFSNNHLKITTESGFNYFIRQYIKMGVFVGGADLEQVPEDIGKNAIMRLKRAITK